MINNEKNQEKTDEKLVSLSLKNQDCFLYIMRRYEARLLRYIKRISNFSQDKSEDVLQDIFIKIYRNLNNFDQSLKFSSWIYRIAHNTVISEHRKEKSRPIYFSSEENDEILNNLKSDLDITKELNLKYLKNNINKILDTLDEKYREVLILKYLEEKSYEEISDILKKPMGTVATLINRAKTQFKKQAKDLNIGL